MRGSRRALALALLLPLLALALLASPALAGPPNFTSTVISGGLRVSDIVSTDQVVRFGFSTDQMTSDAAIENITVDFGGFNPSGAILTSPAPDCPSGAGWDLSAYRIENNTRLVCFRRDGFLGAPSGTSLVVAVSFDAAQSFGSATPINVSVALRDAQGNQSARGAPVTVQFKPVLNSSLFSPYPRNVSKGQPNVPVTFRLRNNANSPLAPSQVASFVSRIVDAAGNIIPSPSPVINGMGSPPMLSDNGVSSDATYTFFLTIPANAANGTLTHTFNFTATDLNSLLSYDSTTAQNGTYVLAPPNLTILSVANSTPFISDEALNNKVNITVQVRNWGEAPASITSKNLVVTDAQGNSAPYFSIQTLDSVSQIISGQTASIIFEVTGQQLANGLFYGNTTISYIDPASGIEYLAATRNNATLFSYDTAAPNVAVAVPASNLYARQGQQLFINATVTDNLAGVTASYCTVTFQAAGQPIQTSTNLSYAGTPVSGACSGNVTIPSDPSLYDFTTIRVFVPDRVANNPPAGGAGSRDIIIYTLLVNTTDALTGEAIQDSPEISDSTVVVVNTSGVGAPITCFVNKTLDHYCPVPPGTIVNITAYSPAYVRNNASLDQYRACVGPEFPSLVSCSAATPTGGFVSKGIALQPNTILRVIDEFGNPLLGFNITLASTDSWQTDVTEGKERDKDGTLNGMIIMPLDTTKHVAPFFAWFNLNNTFNNRGMLSWETGPINPNNFTQTVINKTVKFAMIINTKNQFGDVINISGGSVIYNLDGEFGFPPVACQSNGTNYNVYGCKIPTSAEIGNSSYNATNGARLTVIKQGYVNLLTGRISPPVNPSSPQVLNTTVSNFTIIVEPRDSYNRSLTSAMISSVTLPVTGECKASGDLWGCAAVPGIDLNATVTPKNSSGFLQNTFALAPSDGFQQRNQSANLFTVQLFAKDELGSNVTGNISSVTFAGPITYSCVQNPNATLGWAWGCAVPIGTNSSPVHVNTSLAGYLINHITPSVTPPTEINASYSAVAVSANKYSVKVLATDEFQEPLNFQGVSVRFASGSTTVACMNSTLYEWHCPISLPVSTTVTASANGYVDTPQPVTAPNSFGPQLVQNSSNQFTVMVSTGDELGNYPNITAGGNVTFNSLQCVFSNSTPSQWGCPAAWSSAGNVSVRGLGFIDWNATGISTPSSAGPQTHVTSLNNYTLKVVLTDELGSDLSGATISPIGLSQPSCIANSNRYYCAVSTDSSTVSVSKTGYVTTSAPASGMSSAGPQVLLQMTNNTGFGLPFTAKISVAREVANNATQMSQGVSFVNFTSGSPVAPSASSSNIFYFAFPTGTQSMIARKSGYVDKLFSFSTAPSTPYIDSADLQFTVKVTLLSDNGSAIVSGASFSPTPFFQNGSTSSYFFPLANGAATVTASRTGFVTNSTPVAANGTYPSGQSQYVLRLPHTVKVSSLDFGGKALNATTVNIKAPNGTLLYSVTLEGNANTAYFEIDPLTYPSLSANVAKASYNTFSLGPSPVSSASPREWESFHAQNIVVNLTDWHLSAVAGAKIELFRNNTLSKFAECVTPASGICTFNSSYGPTTPDDSIFNSNELSEGDTLVVGASKTDFGPVQKADGTYYFQNATPPFDAGNVRIGGNVRVYAFQSWGSLLALANASVYITNATAATVGKVTTNSSGYAIISPDFYAEASAADAKIAPSELPDFSPYSLFVQKAGYAMNSTSLSFNSSAPALLNRSLSDNEPPMIVVATPANATAFTLNSFDLNFSTSDPYGADGSGLNTNRTYYRIENLTGFPVRNWTNVCTGAANCSVLAISGLDLPTGHLFLKVNSSDVVGNQNVTAIDLNSRPGVRKNSVAFLDYHAFSNGFDVWKIMLNVTLKGTSLRMLLSNFKGVFNPGNELNITDASCPGGFCATLAYFNSTSCGPAGAEGNRSFTILNNYTTGVFTEPICDQNLSTQYAREQSVILRVAVPAGTISDNYTATYDFDGGPSPPWP